MFPAIRVAREAGTAGGSLTAVYNAANEVAAQAFLDGALRFDRIVPTIAEVLAAADEWRSPPGSVDEVFAADQWARTRAAAVVGATGVEPVSFALGVAGFAIALVLSVAWHECGHMWAAQATGMKVRRYFVGFGPTLWSTRRGETEYGFKAIPAGGFCDIAGMTPYEDLSADEESRAMYKQKPWKRLVVLVAGPLQNFILGFLLIIVLAVGWGCRTCTRSQRRRRRIDVLRGAPAQ